MSDSPHIVLMDAASVEQVAQLEARCFSTPWSLQSFVGELANPRAVYFTAYLGERLAGYAGLHHIADEGDVTNIAVEPAFRRRGVAAALLEQLLTYAHKHALRLLTLEVRVSNTPAIALYEGYGFHPCGLRRGYYTRPTEDALLMSLELAPEQSPSDDR